MNYFSGFPAFTMGVEKEEVLFLIPITHESMKINKLCRQSPEVHFVAASGAQKNTSTPPT